MASDSAAHRGSPAAAELSARRFSSALPVGGQIWKNAILGTNIAGNPGGLSLQRRVAARVCLIAAAVLAGAVTPAGAISPDSPEVRKVIDKAFAFLETVDEKRFGGKCLVALAYVKDGKDEAHPRVAEAVAACQALCAGDPAAINADIYSTGIAVIFLCDLNPTKYKYEIVKLLKSLELRQKVHGGWGYPNKDTGDTSMTQYGVLSCWVATKAGFEVNQEVLERVADWLLRTQDPDGNWGYQGKVNDSLTGPLIKQDPNRLGMTAAGLGSTYIVGDLLQLFDPPPPPDPALPSALRPVRQGPKRKPLTEKIPLKLWQRAVRNGNEWMRKRYKIDPDGFTYYYMYALERYQSFQELFEGKLVREPKWYNDGYAFLRRTQAADGHWLAKSGPAADTSFGILFLLRSTKKSIERSRTLSAGVLVAGRGLPASVEQVEVRDGRIVAKTPARGLAQLLDDLENPASPQLADLLANPEQLYPLLRDAPPAEQTRYYARLRNLALAGGPEVRELAVRTLARLHDLDSAVTMIAALNDPDWRVVRAADEGLLLVSRSSARSGLGQQPSETDRRATLDRWRQWLAQVRPDVARANE